MKFPIIKLILRIDYLNMFKSLAFNNFMVKLVALFTALILYVYVGLENRVEKLIRVPLTMENQPKGYVISGEKPPRSVTIRLYGSQGGLAKVEEDQIFANINLEKASKGINVYYPSIDYNFPKSVKLDRMSPDKIEIELSKRSKKIVTIEPTFINEPKKDIVIIGHKIKPQRIYIFGPENILKDTVNIYTEPIDLKGLKENTEFEVKISKSTSPLLEFNRERSFRVTVNTGKEFVLKEIDDFIPVFSQEQNENLVIENDYIGVVSKVKVNVLIDSVESFDKDKDIYFYVNLSKYNKPGSYDVEVSYELSEHVEMVSFTPTSLKINLIRNRDNEEN